ncbi:MAG: hypothetical protein IIY70_01040 [Oscillospiraceae bacterium]|nr:hypothetical protein [Oscillospiraceae bacterium]
MRLSIFMPESGRTLRFPIPTSLLLVARFLPNGMMKRGGADQTELGAMRAFSKNAKKALRRYVRTHGHFDLICVETSDGEIIHIRV